jgi:hypothetical protein
MFAPEKRVWQGLVRHFGDARSRYDRHEEVVRNVRIPFVATRPCALSMNRAATRAEKEDGTQLSLAG